MRGPLTAAALLAVLLASGCATTVPPVPESAQASSPPAVLQIPSLGIDTRLTATGLAPDQEIQVPDVHTPDVAAWVSVGPKPGDPGRSVIVGHINGDGQAGIFGELATMKAGDQITVIRDDHTTLRFVVDQVVEYPKAHFPRGLVYGDTDQRVLELISCSGNYDPAAHSYTDNTVVYAKLT